MKTPKSLSNKASPRKKSAQPRPRYSLREKIEIVRYAAAKKADLGWSNRQVARRRNVDEGSIRKWIKDYKNMIVFDNKSKLSMRKVFQESQLDSVKEEILLFIFERREQGHAVTRRTLILKISTLLPEFAVKTWEAQLSAVRRFLEKCDLVYRLGTHQSQVSPTLAVSDAVDFVDNIRPFLYGSRTCANLPT
jgi:hypothetical protein